MERFCNYEGLSKLFKVYKGWDLEIIYLLKLTRSDINCIKDWKTVKKVYALCLANENYTIVKVSNSYKTNVLAITKSFLEVILMWLEGLKGEYSYIFPIMWVILHLQSEKGQTEVFRHCYYS